MSGNIRELIFGNGPDTVVCKERDSTVNGNTDVMVLRVEGGCVTEAVLRASITGAHFAEIHLNGDSQQAAGTLVELDLGLMCHGDGVDISYILEPQPPTADVVIRYVVYEKQNAANCSNEAVVQIKTSCP